MAKKKATRKKRTKKVVEPVEVPVLDDVEAPVFDDGEWYNYETDRLGGFAVKDNPSTFLASNPLIANTCFNTFDPVLIDDLLELPGKLRDMEHRVTALEILVAATGVAAAAAAIFWWLL